MSIGRENFATDGGYKLVLFPNRLRRPIICAPAGTVTLARSWRDVMLNECWTTCIVVIGSPEKSSRSAFSITSASALVFAT